MELDETVMSPQLSVQLDVTQTISDGETVWTEQVAAPMLTVVSLTLPLNPPPAIVILCPPLSDPELGVMLMIDMELLSSPREPAAFPTAP